MSNQPLINNSTFAAQESPIGKNSVASAGSAAFQPGMSGLTSAALLEVMMLLSEVANLEGDQFVKQIESAKTTAKYLGQYQQQMGVEEFNQYLTAGITQAVGGLISLTASSVSTLKSFDIESTQQEMQGVKNYKEAVLNRKSLSALRETPEGTEMETLSDVKPDVQTRVQQLKDQEKFTDGKNQALKIEDQQGEDVSISDKEVIKKLSQEEADDLVKSFDAKLKSLDEKLTQKLQAKSAFDQKMATVSQGLNGVVSGSGQAGSGKFAELKATMQAAATEAQAALQGLQQIDNVTQSQFNKLMESASALTQVLSAIANANALIN